MKSRTINGLTLPRQLVDLIAEGRWTAPDDDTLEALFGEKPSQGRFYSWEEMEFENAAWRTETLPEYLGEADERFRPGDIDPRASVLIGDLGHDLPFALDYRQHPENPRVVFLGTRVNARWVTVANDINELITALGLGSSDGGLPSATGEAGET